MLDYNYTEELETRTVTPDYITKNYGGGIFCNFIFDSGIALARVICYAIANEEELFIKAFDGISETQAPYYHKRLNYEELFNCLSLLGDDCLRILLSKLNCNDEIIYDLHQSIVNKNLHLFQDTIIRGSINSDVITPICRLLYINIFIEDLFEKAYKIDQELDQISDKELHDKKERQAIKYVLSVTLSFIRQVVATDSSDDSQNFALILANMENAINANEDMETDDLYYNSLLQIFSKSPNFPKDISKEDFFVFLYKLVLYSYFIKPKELNMSSMAQDAIHKILFKPEYKYIWGKYDNIENAADTILDEVGPYFDDDENDADVMQQNEEDVRLIEAHNITEETDNADVEANDNELSLSDYEKAMEAITEIIEAIEDQIKEPYNKERIVRLFQELFDGNDYEYKKMKKYLIERGDNLKYKNICIAHISYIFGYLMAKEVFYDSPTKLARLIKYLIDKRASNDMTENIRTYIQGSKGKQKKRLNIAQTKLFDQLLAKI